MLGSTSCAYARSATTTRVAAASKAAIKSFAALSTFLAVGATARDTVFSANFSPSLSLTSTPHHPASGCSGASQTPLYYSVWLLLSPDWWADDQDLPSPDAHTVPGRIGAYARGLRVAALLEEFNVRPLPREGELTVRKPKEVFLLVVDKVREALLAQHHLKHVKGIGSSATTLLVAAKSTHRLSVTTGCTHRPPPR